MQDVLEQEAHLESGGAVPPRLTCCSGFGYCGLPLGSPGCGAAGERPPPSFGLGLQPAHSPAPGPAAVAASAEGPLPRAALCLFF